MEYKFKMLDYYSERTPIEMRILDFGVEYDSIPEDEKHLFEIAWSEWTVEEIQMIIDKSMALQGDQMYGYQVAGSDLMIYIYTDEAQFFSARSEKEEADISWTFDKFIDFMEQFKAFVRENS